MNKTLLLIAISAALPLARVGAWVRKPCSDAEAVGRAELIVVARLKEGSIEKIMVSDGSLTSPYGLPLHRATQPIGFWIAATFYVAACVFLLCASAGEIWYAMRGRKHR